YNLGLADWQPVNKAHLTADLNAGITEMRHDVAVAALTVLREDSAAFPLRSAAQTSDAAKGIDLVGTGLTLKRKKEKKIAYIGMGLTEDNAFSRRMQSDYNAHVYFFDYDLDSAKAAAALQLLSGRYEAVVIGIHNYARFPARNFAISRPAAWLLHELQQKEK